MDCIEVLLDQAEWKAARKFWLKEESPSQPSHQGFQYRAVVYGCLLADAEVRKM